MNGLARACLAISLLTCACQAKVNANANVSTAQKDDSSQAWGGESSSTPPASSPAPAPAPMSVTQTTGAARCPLHCNVPHKGRVAAADEARLAEGLASTMEEIHSCVHGRSSLTLRFDSASALTHFGIDADEESPCLTSLRERHPPITMQGPVTLRCTERCGR